MDLPLSAMRQLTITPPETPGRHRVLPNELVCNILCDVLGSSIHRLCTDITKSERDSSWEVRVALTLSAVCFLFREMTRQTILKLFDIRPDALDWTERVQGKIILLRDLALSATRPFGDPKFPPSSDVLMQIKRSVPRNPFLCAYASFLSAVSLCKATTSHAAVFRSAHVSVLNTLMSARCDAAQTMPCRVGRVLVDAVDVEMAYVHMAATVIQARAALDGDLREMDRISQVPNTDDERCRGLAEVQSNISHTLTTLEAHEEESKSCRLRDGGDIGCGGDPAGITRTPMTITPAVVRRALAVCDDIFLTLDNISNSGALTGPYCLDEHDLKRRARDLHECWLEYRPAQQSDAAALATDNSTTDEMVDGQQVSP